MKYWFYYLTENNEPIRVIANQRPSERTGMRGWSLREFDGKEWIMPCFPQVTWGILSKMQYVGKTKHEA